MHADMVLESKYWDKPTNKEVTLRVVLKNMAVARKDSTGIKFISIDAPDIDWSVLTKKNSKVNNQTMLKFT